MPMYKGEIELYKSQKTLTFLKHVFQKLLFPHTLHISLPYCDMFTPASSKRKNEKPQDEAKAR